MNQATSDRRVPRPRALLAQSGRRSLDFPSMPAVIAPLITPFHWPFPAPVSGVGRSWTRLIAIV